MTVAEDLLRKILGGDLGYADLTDDLLVLDGHITLTKAEKEWIVAYWKEMEPVWEAQTHAYWEKTIAQYTQRALAGDTEARERMTYFATRSGEPQKTLARDALIVNGLQSAESLP